MKSFDRLREQTLEEKLKASDPTGKWISDFVHSDNPKFAGKSKKERIRMALGASYASKRQNEEVEQLDEIGDTPAGQKRLLATGRRSFLHAGTKKGGKANVSDLGQKTMDRVEKRLSDKSKNTRLFHTKIKNPQAHPSDRPSLLSKAAGAVKKVFTKEELDLDEAAWGKDKMANLKAAHDRHSEKAIAANKAGDDQAVKVHQSKMNMLKNQMNKLRKEEAESTNEGAQQLLRKYVPGYAKRQIDKKMDAGKFGKDDVAKDANFYRYKKIQDKLKKEETEQIDELKTSTLIRYGTKATQSANKLNDNPAKRDKREYGINRSIQKVKQRYAKEDVERIDEAKHRVQVTVSEPDHPMVTKRKEHQQKFIRVTGDKENAVTKAQQHYKKQGYKVHGAEYVSSVNEEVLEEGKIKVNFKMPSEHLSDKLARRQSELRKKSGLPDPSHYKNVAAQKKKELGEGSIEGGVWSSNPPKKGQPNVDPPSAIVEPIDKNAKDTTTIKPGLGDLNKAFDKIDRENAAKGKKPVKEGSSFSAIRNKLAEAKKMKGEDPCWDNYKMIGTKKKNGKEVPNCVPK